jgi:hypothetical protein
MVAVPQSRQICLQEHHVVHSVQQAAARANTATAMQVLLAADAQAAA